MPFNHTDIQQTVRFPPSRTDCVNCMDIVSCPIPPGYFVYSQATSVRFSLPSHHYWNRPSLVISFSSTASSTNTHLRGSRQTPLLIFINSQTLNLPVWARPTPPHVHLCSRAGREQSSPHCPLAAKLNESRLIAGNHRPGDKAIKFL